MQQVIQDKIFFYCYGDNEVEVHRRGKVRFSKSNNSRLLGKNRTCFDQFLTNVGKEANQKAIRIIQIWGGKALDWSGDGNGIKQGN